MKKPIFKKFTLNFLKTWFPDPYKRDAQGRTALHDASRGGSRFFEHSLNNDTLALGLGLGVQLNLSDLIDCPDNQGRTPVHHVVIRNDYCSLYLLVESGKEVNLDKDDKDGRTALHIAAKQGQLAMVELLLEKNVWLEAGDNRGLTALHLAAMKGHTVAVRSILREAAQRKIRHLREIKEDFYSRTALHYAVLMMRLETVEGLVEVLDDERRVDTTGRQVVSGHVNIQDYQGRTALHLACAILNEIRMQPEGHGRSQHELIQTASAILGVLMDAGASVDVQDYQGSTALHHACVFLSQARNKTREQNDADHHLYHAAFVMISALVDSGANLDIPDNMGCTPLMYAAQGAHLGAVRCLVSKGADVDAVDGRNWTARDYAELDAPQGENRDEVLRILSPGQPRDAFFRLQ